MEQYAIVYFPKIDVNTLTAFQKKYDPKWQVIPPHITLVYPFSGPPKDLLIRHVEAVIKELKSFPIVLQGLVKSFDHCLFLLVKDGNKKISNVRDKLYSGVLEPYKQNTIPFIPHITLGYFGKENDELNEELYQEAYAEAEKMNIYIPTSFDTIALIKGNGIAPATIIKTFNLP